MTDRRSIFMKKKIYNIINSPENPSKASRFFDIFLIILILLNGVSVIVNTFKLSDPLSTIIWYFEFISVIIFTIEYLCAFMFPVSITRI